MANREENNTAKMSTAGTEVARECYEGSVIGRMLERRNGLTDKGAHGIALEVLDMDQLNLRDIAKTGRYTKLTSNTRATQLDAVTIDGGKIARRYQYKDTANSINKTISQVKSGKYDQATLRGTKETAKIFNETAEKAGLGKRMESSGISSKTTTRVADKALAVKNGSVNTVNLVNDLAGAAKCTAVGAAGITAAVEVVKSIANGDDAGTCVNNVVSKGCEAAVSGAVAGVGGEVGAIVGAMINPVLAVPGAIVGGAISGIAAGTAIEEKFDGIGDIAEGVYDTVSDSAQSLKIVIECLFWSLF